MKKNIILLLLAFMFALPANSQVIQLKGYGNSLYSKEAQAQIFKPTKAIIGEDLEFLIKGIPGNFVSLYTSLTNVGISDFHGLKLRLGNEFSSNELQIPETGILKVSVKIPDDKELIDKDLFFEAVTWKQQDLSDIQLVTIIGADAREIDNNGIMILPKPKNMGVPGFGPALPGYNPDLLRAADSLDRIKRGNIAPDAELDVDQTYSRTTPAVLRNLLSPELKTNQNVQE